MSERRWEQISVSIREAIETGHLAPGTRLPSEDQLAAEWQVCRMTAHRAMDELHRLGFVQRKRRVGTTVVGPSAGAVPGEAPSQIARHFGAAKPGRRPTALRVALLLFHVNDYPQVTYLHGFQSGIREEDSLLLCDTQNSAEREYRCLQRAADEADAICCYPTGAPDSTVLLAAIAATGKPVVCLDRLPAALQGVDAVMTDNYHSTAAALRTMTDKGHRQIAFFTTDNLGVSSVRERHEAFIDVLREANVPEEEISSLIRTFPRGAGYDYDRFCEGVHDALFAMLHRRNPPTVLFCLEDYFLWAVIEACDRIGVRVHEDIEILSFSDCPQMVPRLTRSVHRIVQGAYEMGRIAFDRIQRRLDGEVVAPEIVRIPAAILPPSLSTLPVSQRSFTK